ncbi:hypothetical protein GCM10011374_11790 [Kocuria dechangensis]|uniref:Uncharacterized protein n=1 Tax=Kocuria dechangensis TaxID=1176249 RepID=A0A917GLD1_9MICC|nr:hypothetical protein GCM10011374_11790 [Kocuria dechangensis]
MLTSHGTRLPRHELAAIVFQQYKEDGEPISKSKAGRIADKIIRGTFNPDPRLASAIEYQDPTGNTAAANVDRERQRPQCIAAKLTHQGLSSPPGGNRNVY